MVCKQDLIVSVVVCSYNRSKLLDKCLESLVNQDCVLCRYEVIVVNNGSTDNTSEVILTYQNDNNNFRGVHETIQGLSQARNRGWLEAEGSYVAYIDDDAIADSGWIRSIVDFIDRRPDISIFGGPYSAFSLVEYPDWFPPEYGILDYGDEERPINVGSEWITGSNMIIRRSLFLEHGGFDVRLGMSGNTIAYGEEIRFVLAMTELGEQVYYVPSIKVAHLVADYKMRLEWLLRSNFVSGKSHGTIFCGQTIVSYIISMAVTIGWALLELLRPVNIPLKRRLYYAFYRACYSAGTIVGYFTNLSVTYYK